MSARAKGPIVKFLTVDVDQALGHILAHSITLDRQVLKKGSILDADGAKGLTLVGQTSVTVAMLEDGDVGEDAAARILADRFITDKVIATPPFAGRVNLVAKADGVLSLNTMAIKQFNSVDEAITIATLKNYQRVKKGALLATIKIIPYAVQQNQIDDALGCLQSECLQLHKFTPKTCDIILTQVSGFKPSLLVKAEKPIKARISMLNLKLQTCQVVKHTQEDVKQALTASVSDIVLVLGASATSDRRDVVPAGIVAASGTIERFGMPVDPGNLLVLGHHQGRAVIGLPGCVRAPALNGADWVLERLCANIPLTSADIATMGVGGLLKEIPNRIQPRMQSSKTKSGITAVVLAAGQSNRMRGSDKLMRDVGGIPLLRHSVKVALASNADHCVVVVKIGADKHIAALQGLPVKIVEAKDANLGMSASLSAGVLAVVGTPKAILVALSDMPDLTSDHFNQVIDAHNPDANRLIICPIDTDGKRGHPVLFDARYTENLASLQGISGARKILQTVPECVFEVQSDAAVSLDLDTPEAWSDWEKQS